jgi:hypothetical protein
MKIFALLLTVLIGQDALALEVKECESNYIGINTIVWPLADNTRSFYNGQVQVYKVDYLEPACCSTGLAFVLPDVQSEIGDSKCVTVTGLSGVDVKNAKAAYNPNLGLLITFATRTYDHQNGGTLPGPLLKVRVNLKNSSVKIE